MLLMSKFFEVKGIIIIIIMMIESSKISCRISRDGKRRVFIPGFVS